MNWFNRDYAYSVFAEYATMDFRQQLVEHLPKGEINQYGKAMLGVAQFLERDPTNYKFKNGFVPSESERGCLIGIAARSAGIPEGISVSSACRDVFGMSENEFYTKMFDETGWTSSDWQRCGITAAKILRRVASRQTMKV